MKEQDQISSNYKLFKKKLILIGFYQDNYDLVDEDIAYILFSTENMIVIYKKMILSGNSPLAEDVRGKGFNYYE